MSIFDTAEGRRLRAIGPGARWRRWGPYLSDRQWGTVREDYSALGSAWDSFPHDQARSRAYRWGEDGIAGFGDDQLRWCLGLALWNEQDPILKERLFGLTNHEGNHGEDVKEVYFYTDGLPTHSYMRMLYRYPQAAFPYVRLIEENAARGLAAPEFELADTGIFAEGRCFDVTVEYAKAGPFDILMQITTENRGPDAAPLHLLPHLWARNTWSWEPGAVRPLLRAATDGSVRSERDGWRARRFDVEGAHPWLFCENETNVRRLFGLDRSGPFKDGIGDFVVHGDATAIAHRGEGTKCAAHARFVVPAHGSIRLRARYNVADEGDAPFADFDQVMADRRSEADEFHAVLSQAIVDPDARQVQRQAFAGLLWTKQFYFIDMPRWLAGDPAQPKPPAERLSGRNQDWRHLNNADILSMPDSWEYPWYAAWDLAFQAVVFAAMDPEFAKSQLLLLTREWYMHPNGQLPAYEWAFGDVNPPVHAWAALRVYHTDAALTGVPDRNFLERVFHKLMLNFTWWVNRKDRDGRHVFQGGFLGLDNIGLFDRSQPLPTGGTIDQADGTAWMAVYALDMMRIALTLAVENPVYEDVASKFFEHFLGIAEAMSGMGGGGLWDEETNFFYDVLRLGDGTQVPLRVRSLVGLVPLFAVEVLHGDVFKTLPGFSGRLRWVLNNRPELAKLVSRWTEPGAGEVYLLSLLRGHRMKALLRRALDETEFLSAYGVRSLSKYHAAHPCVFEHGGQRFEVGYVPGDSTAATFGGNSNWRGPIWMPVNMLLIQSLRRFYSYYGDEFRIECPVGSGTMLHLGQIADELSVRLSRLFQRGADGKRPSMPDALPNDPVLFYEYFDGDTGRGLGASHQTGWTALIALLLDRSGS